MMKFKIIMIFLLGIIGNHLYSQKSISLNRDWKFSLSDEKSACKEVFNDATWRSVTLPHDWALERGYRSDGDQQDRGGYASGGIGWYRKQFSLSEKEVKEKVLSIFFEGVYMNSEVWINGKYLGKRPYGYISFEYDITPYVKEGENIIAVRVDNSKEPSARWYHGCGIYADVELTIKNRTHFSRWGTFVTTPKITTEQAEIRVENEVLGVEAGDRLVFRVLNPKGKTVSSVELDSVKERNNISFKIDDPLLWGVNSPNLYRLESRVYRGKQLLDSKIDRFGIRDINWDAETGFYLNGENVKLQGVCEHLEGGPVGAAWTKNLIRWKVSLLKDMGCNAIRTAHNPQVPYFYEVCDELGILVMNEAFDGWGQKANEDYGKQAFDEWWEKDLRAMIRRDRNHPCVIIYSVGNETRGKVAQQLVEVCRDEDPTRLVTSGDSGGEHMDVYGVNGHSEKQSFINNYKPKGRAFVGTETPHTWQVRGYYRTKTWYRDGYPHKKHDPFFTPDLTPQEIFTYEWTSPAKWDNYKQHFNSSYDNAYVRINARQNIEVLRDKSWYSGHFRWTGFDYLGEAGYVHGGWPFRAFMGGVIDMAGFEKDHYYLYQGEWTKKNMIHILPHWSHPDMKIGTEIPIWVYTSGDEVELLVNGESKGRVKKGKSWDQMQCQWLVDWNPGMIEAVAYRDGIEIARTTHRTVLAPTKLALDWDQTHLLDREDDTHIVTIKQVDDLGTLYPYGENRVYFYTDASTHIVSAENGDPVDTETNYKAPSKKAFFGLLRTFLRTDDKSTQFTAGAILGDKRLKSSNEITIDVISINNRSKIKSLTKDFEIYYTLDGSRPSRNAKKYSAPFALDHSAVVKAIVYYKNKELFVMTEEFGPNCGIYWWDGKTKFEIHKDMQAEACEFRNCKVENSLTDFRGKGYVALLNSKSFITMYQEHDGSKYDTLLELSFARTQPGEFSFELFNNDGLESRVKVIVESDEVGKWKTVKLPFTIQSGANLLKIKSTEFKGVKIDWIEVK